LFGVTLIAGRFFTPADVTDETKFNSILLSELERLRELRDAGVVLRVAIINQTLARRFWPEENAVGKIIYDRMLFPCEIVGVVQDFHQVSGNKNIFPAFYYPTDYSHPDMIFSVRLHSEALMKDFRRRLSGFDAGSVMISMQPLEEIVSESMVDINMTLQLLGGFALLGIVAAGLGVYATTSLMMAAMNREMGIRMAMGAQFWDMLRFALWRGTRSILIGLPLGLFLAWILSRVLSSYLLQVKIDDPLAWIVSSALLLGITIIAAFIPALRATRVNPLDAMRGE
jgi:putative ABC transport system permease protein